MFFIAALDSSGGSTGGVLDRYGAAWTEETKFSVIHQMRERIARSPSFNQNSLFGAILFKDSFDRGLHQIIHNRGIPTYLKIDNGVDESGEMKPIWIQKQVELAQEYGAHGTKMRSIIHNMGMIGKILRQQFIIASQIPYPLTPIIEPEISINNENKRMIEEQMVFELYDHLDKYNGRCILKVTPPETPNLYYQFTKHPKVSHVVFLSGGHSKQRATNLVGLNDDVKASFSRALLEGLHINQTDEEFNNVLDENITLIRNASK